MEGVSNGWHGTYENGNLSGGQSKQNCLYFSIMFCLAYKHVNILIILDNMSFLVENIVERRSRIP